MADDDFHRQTEERAKEPAPRHSFKAFSLQTYEANAEGRRIVQGVLLAST